MSDESFNLFLFALILGLWAAFMVAFTRRLVVRFIRRLFDKG